MVQGLNLAADQKQHHKGLTEYFGLSLVPRRSLLPRCRREVWERAGERTPSQYWQNTPDFGAILPLVTFYEFLQLHFRKTARR